MRPVYFRTFARNSGLSDKIYLTRLGSLRSNVYDIFMTIVSTLLHWQQYHHT